MAQKRHTSFVQEPIAIDDESFDRMRHGSNNSGLPGAAYENLGAEGIPINISASTTADLRKDSETSDNSLMHTHRRTASFGDHNSRL